MARRAVMVFCALTTQASVTNALSVKASRSFDSQGPRRFYSRNRTPNKLSALDHPASPIGVDGVDALPFSPKVDTLLSSVSPSQSQPDAIAPESPRSLRIRLGLLQSAKNRAQGDLPAVKAPMRGCPLQQNSSMSAESKDLYSSLHAPRGSRFDGTLFGQTDDAYKNSNANEVCRSPGRGESKCDGPRAERNHFEFGTVSHDDYAAIGSEQLNCHHATVITSDARNGMWDDVDRLLVANPSLTDTANNFVRTDGLPVVRTPDPSRTALSSTWHGEPLSPSAETVARPPCEGADGGRPGTSHGGIG
jgi:hypothetical protein